MMNYRNKERESRLRQIEFVINSSEVRIALLDPDCPHNFNGWMDEKVTISLLRTNGLESYSEDKLLEYLEVLSSMRRIDRDMRSGEIFYRPKSSEGTLTQSLSDAEAARRMLDVFSSAKSGSVDSSSISFDLTRDSTSDEGIKEEE